MTWFCYILGNSSEVDKNRTYNGMTNTPQKRLRQHNQEITGGARYTKRYGDQKWEFIGIIKGLPDKINCLQCEWRIKHPDNRRKRSRKYAGPEGRILGMLEVLCLDKWTNNSEILNDALKIEVFILEKFKDIVNNYDKIDDIRNKENIQIHLVEEITEDILNY